MLETFKRVAPALLAFVSIASAAAVTRAASAPLDAGGFESFSPGSITPVAIPGVKQLGQQGWIGTDFFGGTLNLPTAVIQSAVVKSGTQALRVDRAPNVDNIWTVLFGANTSATRMSLTLPQNQGVLPTGRFVLIDWDMTVNDAGGTGVNGDFGPFFGITANDDTSGFASVLGSLGVDASTGEVFYQAPGGNFAEAGPLVQFEQWNHFAILLDYSLDKFSVFLNGAMLKSDTFVDGSTLSRFTDADVTAISMAQDPASIANSGTAYFDNLRVLDGIPGDFDIDGDIDGTDLGFWGGAYGSTAVGNADGDGDSDGNDFLIWQQNVGVDLVPPTTAVGAAVPEPAALTIIATAISAGVVRRRRTAY